VLVDLSDKTGSVASRVKHFLVRFSAQAPDLSKISYEITSRSLGFFLFQQISYYGNVLIIGCIHDLLRTPCAIYSYISCRMIFQLLFGLKAHFSVGYIICSISIHYEETTIIYLVSMSCT
jgi:hypothetical protein